jgi:uncharacterized protein YndB with AHSA1/START domain
VLRWRTAGLKRRAAAADRPWEIVMDQDRSAATARTLAHPPEAVFAAFETPERLAAWWGPAGFTNEFERFDFRVGGRWVFVMQAPDGTRTAQAVRHVVEPANEQNLDRLEAVLAAGG